MAQHRGPEAGSREHGNKTFFFLSIQGYMLPVSFVVKKGNQAKNGLKFVYFAS